MTDAAGGPLTVAALRENEGRRTLRTSVSGEPRGVLCAMGVCFECRMTLGVVDHRRACMEMTPEAPPAGPASRVEEIERDVVVVGAGPAGIAAACRAAEAGARTLVLDENPAPGGQIHRHRPGEAPPEAARPWLERLAASGALVRSGATVFDAERAGGGFRAVAETAGTAVLSVRARALVLATGARELFLPFPGWTLPGVMGAGGAQAMKKMGADLRGRTAVVAGSGPLLFPVAASLAGGGAEVALVAEQAGLAALARFGAALAARPARLLEAARHRAGFFPVPYRTGTWIAEALGRDRLEAVVLTDGRDRFTVACDLAAVGYGLLPNVELARLLGCEVREGAVAADGSQATSVEGVFAAGEPCGVAGLDVALAEGQVAGLAAAGRRASEGERRDLAAARARGRSFASALDRAFRPRPELAFAVRADTIVCRCEDVRLQALAGCSSAREAKLSTRAGMGPCQGRVCGPALEFLFGWDSDTVRPPVKPAALGSLAAMEDPA